MNDLYPTEILKSKFLPIRDIVEEYKISEESIMQLVDKGKLMYALMKDPKGNKRIPHVNFEQLSNILEL